MNEALEPREVWMLDVDDQRMRLPVKKRLIGETSRSWLIGYRGSPAKYDKKRYRILADEDGDRMFNERQWVLKNAGAISLKVCPMYANPDISYETLRKIAAIVGYVEGEK